MSATLPGKVFKALVAKDAMHVFERLTRQEHVHSTIIEFSADARLSGEPSDLMVRAFVPAEGFLVVDGEGREVVFAYELVDGYIILESADGGRNDVWFSRISSLRDDISVSVLTKFHIPDDLSSLDDILYRV